MSRRIKNAGAKDEMSRGEISTVVSVLREDLAGRAGQVAKFKKEEESRINARR